MTDTQSTQNPGASADAYAAPQWPGIDMVPVTEDVERVVVPYVPRQSTVMRLMDGMTLRIEDGSRDGEVTVTAADDRGSVVQFALTDNEVDRFAPAVRAAQSVKG